MSKEIVKYHNDMNRLNLGTFSSKELDLFFSICYRLKELGTKEIILSFDELKNLLGEKSNPKRFKSYINNLNKNLSYLSYQIELKENVFSRFVLFTNFTTDFNKNTLTIKVNDDFGYFLNNLVKEFTKFELEQFVNLKSSYSKNVFKLLKQWETKKKRVFPLEEFKNLLGIPITYTMDNINKRVLNQIMKELSPYFKDLKLEKIKTGRSITSLKFTWETNRSDIELIEDNIIHISEKLNRTIEKAKRNRFIKPFLTEKDIKKLLDKFNEEQLIKGLNHAYKEVKPEISSLSYLVKAIETGAGKQDIKIVVKENDLKESMETKIIETVEVVETIGEGTEQQIEIKEVEYKKDLEGAKKFLFAKTISLKISNKVNIINNLKTLESAIEFGEKYCIDMNYFKNEEIVENEERVENKIKVTQSEYNELFKLRLTAVRFMSDEIDEEEEKRKFDLKYIIVETKEITRKEVLDRFDQLNFTYSFDELEDAFDRTGIKYTNQEWLNLINNDFKRKTLDEFVKNMRKHKANKG